MEMETISANTHPEDNAIVRRIEFQIPSSNTDPGPARGLKVFTEDPQKGHFQSFGRSLNAVPGGVFVLGSPFVRIINISTITDLALIHVFWVCHFQPPVFFQLYIIH
jgi:hypothetical protein